MSSKALQPLAASFQSLSLSSKSRTTHFRPRTLIPSSHRYTRCQYQRTFTTSTIARDWLRPNKPEKSKSMVGRPRMQMGGSVRGTTVVWGDYGLRMKDHDRRISSKQLQLGYQTIANKLRGMNYKIYTRVSANIGVYTKGNEVRMGKGKGKFDYWAARVPVNRVVFELSGMVHEKVVKEAFRLAGHKMPGQWEFVRKGDPPVVGLTKLGNGVTLEVLKRARREVEPNDKTSEESDMIVGPSRTDKPAQTVSTTMSPEV